MCVSMCASVHTDVHVVRFNADIEQNCELFSLGTILQEHPVQYSKRRLYPAALVESGNNMRTQW